MRWDGVRENLDTCGLDEVLLKRDVGSAIRVLVNPAWVGRGEKDVGREEFEVFASIKQHERECCEKASKRR